MFGHILKTLSLRHHKIIASCVFAVCWLILLLAVIIGTRSFGMMDTGDFERVANIIIDTQSAGYQTHIFNHWTEHLPFRQAFKSPFNGPEVTSDKLLHYFVALVQRLVLRDYHLVYFGDAAKLLAFLGMSALIFRMENVTYKRFILLCGLSVLVFAEHNAAFFNSFYQEQVFIIFLPFICTLFWDETASRNTHYWCGLGVFMVSMAKSQYFYLPMLLLIFTVFTHGKSLIVIPKVRRFLCFLIAIQALSLGLLFGGKHPNTPINYYNSLYFGSLMKLQPNEYARLSQPVQQACVGADYWGHVYSIESGLVNFDPKRASCGVSSNKKIKTSDVLEPYFAVPDLWRRMYTEMPIWRHFTVNYFHVYQDKPFRTASTESATDSRPDRVEQGLSWFFSESTSLHELFLAKASYGLCFVGALMFLVRNRMNGRARSICISVGFLSAIISSQILLAILGEGYRDLSKHLAAAQFSMDLMVFFLIYFISICIHRGLKDFVRKQLLTFLA